MTTKRAIGILKDMRAEIDKLPPAQTLPTTEHRTWLWRMKGYADKFFLHGSNEHVLLTHTSFAIYSNIEQFKGTSRLEQQKEVNEEAKRRIDHCIDHLRKFGVHTPPKENFLSAKSNEFIVGVGLLILGAVGTGIYLFGRNVSDRETMKIERDYKELRDSLRTVQLNIHLHNGLPTEEESEIQKDSIIKESDGKKRTGA